MGMQQGKSVKLSQEELAAIELRHVSALDTLEQMLGWNEAYMLITEYRLDAIERGIAKGKRTLLRMLRHEGEWS